MRRFIYLFIGLIPVIPAIIFGGIMLFKGGNRITTSISSNYWRPVDAKIIKMQVDTVKEEEGYDYIPVIEYRYLVNGENFISNRITIDKGHPENNNSLLEKYQKHEKIRIYVSPTNSKESCIIRGMCRNSWIVMLTGLLLFIDGILFLCLILLGFFK